MRTFNKLLLVFIMLASMKYGKAQTALSQDPLYRLVFSEGFDSLGIRTSNWWGLYDGWSYNMHDSNYWYMPWYYNGGAIDQGYNFDGVNTNTDGNRAFHTSGSGTSTGYTSLITRYKSTPLNEPIYIFGHKLPPNQAQDSTWTTSVPFKFTTAMLQSKYKFKYGYIEMSFRTSSYSASQYNAYSPNFWMYASDTSANYSEIDISEIEGKNWTTAPCSHYRHYPNVDNNGNHIAPAHGGAGDTAFWHGNTFETPSTYIPYSRYHSAALTPGNWHTIGCEWTPDWVDIYYYTLSNAPFQRFTSDKYPVNKLTAMPIIIDNYTPAPRDSFFIPFDPIHTNMDFNYDIDYVKVYQVKQHCISKSFLNTSSSTYADTLWQNLTIGGTGGSAVFSSGNHHLAGNDYVLLQEGFEVSGTGTVLINAMTCQAGQSMSYSSSAPNPPTQNSLQIRRDQAIKQHATQ